MFKYKRLCERLTSELVAASRDRRPARREVGAKLSARPIGRIRYIFAPRTGFCLDRSET